MVNHSAANSEMVDDDCLLFSEGKMFAFQMNKCLTFSQGEDKLRKSQDIFQLKLLIVKIPGG